jgi:hypothetical protein
MGRTESWRKTLRENQRQLVLPLKSKRNLKNKKRYSNKQTLGERRGKLNAFFGES